MDLRRAGACQVRVARGDLQLCLSLASCHDAAGGGTAREAESEAVEGGTASEAGRGACEAREAAEAGTAAAWHDAREGHNCRAPRATRT